MTRKFKKRTGKGKTSKLSQEEIIQRFKDVHGNKYDLSRVRYINSKKKLN